MTYPAPYNGILDWIIIDERAEHFRKHHSEKLESCFVRKTSACVRDVPELSSENRDKGRRNREEKDVAAAAR